MTHVKLITCESGDWQILEANGTEWVSDEEMEERC